MKKKRTKKLRIECPIKTCGVPVARMYRGETDFLAKYCQSKNWENCPHFKKNNSLDPRKGDPRKGWMYMACR